MIRNIGMPDRAQQNRVRLAEQLERVLRHHAAVREVILRAPLEILVAAREIVLEPRRIEDPLRRGNDFLADSIAGDH